ncbi:MAG: carbohydrate-binding domain-containing protein [Proteobacteria bacterium]|nr:carbohydrate-binding domain-containing protein [Pseudomonadota bacterium]MCL2307078.1 carbohydrate-binding domain-containing protein [Pseudomonadota bacterium]
MKQPLFHLLGGAVLALGFSFSATALAQETITHPPFPLLSGILAPTGSLYGKSASVSGNSVTLNSGAISYFYGGSNYVDSDVVTNNRVFINGGTVGGGMVGNHERNYAGDGGDTVAADNSLTINDGTVSGNLYGGNARNNSADATASNNNITISGGTMDVWWLVGGYASGGHSEKSTTATASGNSVTIGGNVTISRLPYQLWGGFAVNRAAPSTAAVASGNSVAISSNSSNAIAGGEIYGGFASNYSGTTIVSGNSVTISSDAMVGGRIYGGRADNEGDATASNNSVTIHGASPFNFGELYGGVGKVSTGNTLNLRSIGTVAHIGAFQNLNFYLPTMLVTGGTMLTVTGLANIPDAAKVSVALEGVGPPLRTGDWFILTHVVSCKLMDDATCGYRDFQPVSGTVGGHPYTVAKEGACLVLTIGDQQGVSPAQCTSPGRDYTGQWISADGEDAWGLSVLANFWSNPRYLFVPWYTYDKEGNAAWYIFQGDNWTANDTMTAGVRRYKGPSWGTMPYDNGNISFEEVGTATLTFTSATTATFQYNVEGAERTINLDRLDGAPCAEGSGCRARWYTGQWVKDGEDAWGLTVLGGFPSKPQHLFVPWYTYDKDGNAAWYIFQGDSEHHYTDGWNFITEMSADVYRYTGSPWGTLPYDNDKIVDTKVGTAKLTFSGGTAQFEYDVEGSKRTVELRKLE